MKQLIQWGAACALLFAFNAPSFAWGNFSGWTTSPPNTTLTVCSAKRSTGSMRYGAASVFALNFSGTLVTYALAQNITGNNKAADLWVQTASVRGGPNQMGPQMQAFNVAPNDLVSVSLVTPIADTMARCAVQ